MQLRWIGWLCGRQQQQMSWQWMQLRWILIDFGCSWWWQQQCDGGDFQRTDIWLAAWQQHDGGLSADFDFGCVVGSSIMEDFQRLICSWWQQHCGGIFSGL